MRELRAKENQNHDGKNLPIKNRDQIERHYAANRFIPSKSNNYKCLVLLHKGDAHTGIRGRPPLWYKPSAWTMFLLEPNGASAKVDGVDIEKNMYGYVCTRKFICAQSIPLADFIEVDVLACKFDGITDVFNLPNCTDRTGRNRVIVENSTQQNFKFLRFTRSRSTIITLCET